MATDLRAVSWTGTSIRLIDQTALPGRLTYLEIDDVDALVDAIGRLVVRGAPTLGVVGALGVVVAVRQGRRAGWDEERLAAEIDRVRTARPTAVNLAWGVDQVAQLVGDGEETVLIAALKLADETEAANHTIGSNGSDWILGRVRRRPIRVLTHCNAGALATQAWGTALGIVRELHGRGHLEVVYADETRPLLQGSRLTAWELAREGIPHLVAIDGAATSTILQGLVDVAIIGADRIAANGDTANKIGSVGVALACHHAGIPFVVAAPESTVDPATATGADIHIELRDDDEVLHWGGLRTAPDGSRAYNPAFDVTPAAFVSALVTEARVLEVAAGQIPGGAVR
jgi:methylthioribose-1-phosphate isomerase